MDCKKIQHNIDDLIYSNGRQLYLQEQSHLNECDECRKYYTDLMETKQFLQKFHELEPVLDKPEELTESIMMSISQEEQNSLNDHNNRFKILVRFLTAAVVALLVTLGIEQYTVLNKVQLLEVKMGKVQHDHPTKYLINRASLIDIEQILRVSENGNKLKNISTWYQLEQFKNSDFTFNDLQRYNNKAGTLNSFFN
jgi:predicted anti-sigma-YlaC factor YlaD